MDNANKQDAGLHEFNPELLSRISHEMRTPMNVVIGMTRMAMQQDDPEKMREYLRRVESSAWHLLDVINDMLDVVRLQCGGFELTKGPFTLSNIVSNALSRVTQAVREKGHKLTVSLADDIPPLLFGDPARLTQVLSNLLSNAVKFTPDKGEITLLGRLLYAEGDQAELEFRVKDTGIGISPENQKKLFRSYEQLDGGMNRKFDGTGLGLVITKNIVELMQGQIDVCSEEGKGTEVAVRVRLGRGDSSEAPKKILPLHRHNVLAVDDNDETLLFLVNMLHNLNVRCDLARSGGQAIEKAEAAYECGDPYTVILMDWRMPGMSGLDAARAIQGKTGDAATFVMVSMAEWSDMENDARSIGIDKFLNKPVTVSSLVDILGEITAVSLKSEGLRAELTGKRILLCDDARVNQEIAAELLRRCGAVVETAGDGEQVLRLFRAHPKWYNLIVLDIDMPLLDGRATAKAIRAEDTPLAKTVPLLAMTANTGSEDVRLAIDAGMNGYVNKPLDIEKFYSEVNRLISNDMEEKKTGELLDELPGLDVKDALSRLRNNKKLLFTLLNSFLSDNSEQELALLIEAGNTAEAEKKAHAIKGASGNLGLKDIYRDASTLNLMLRNSETKEMCGDTLVSLLHGFDVARETARIVGESL